MDLVVDVALVVPAADLDSAVPEITLEAPGVASVGLVEVGAALEVLWVLDNGMAITRDDDVVANYRNNRMTVVKI